MEKTFQRHRTVFTHRQSIKVVEMTYDSVWVIHKAKCTGKTGDALLEEVAQRTYEDTLRMFRLATKALSHPVEVRKD